MRYRTTSIEELFPTGVVDGDYSLYVYSVTNNPDGAGKGTDAQHLGDVESYSQAADLWDAAEATAKAIYGPQGSQEIGLCIESPVTFTEALDELCAKVCEPCNGTGELNDADPGDITFNTWRCVTCKGTGFAPC